MRRLRFSLGLVIPVLIGCGREAIDFNQRVAAIHGRLGKAVEEFGRVVHPAIEEATPPTPEAFREASERLRTAFSSAEVDSGTLAVPDLSQAAELIEAQREFLAAQRRLLEAELPEIQRLLENKELTPKGLEDQLKTRLAALRAEESRHLEAMHAAQRKFAEVHGLKLAPEQDDAIPHRQWISAAGGDNV